MNLIKHLGLALFLTALGLFITLLFLSRYEVTEERLAALSADIQEVHQPFVDENLRHLEGIPYGFKFTFLAHAKSALAATNKDISERFGLSDEALSKGVPDCIRARISSAIF